MEHGAIREVRSQAIPEFRSAAYGLRAVGGASSPFVLSISDTTSIYRDVGVAPTTLSLPGELYKLCLAALRLNPIRG